MVWRDVVGWEGYYEVSDSGAVRRRESVVLRRHGLTQRIPERILSPSVSQFGYHKVSLSDKSNGRVRSVFVHRLVAEAFISPQPHGCEINHIDGVKTNNCVENLEWATPLENQRHSWRTGLHTHNKLTCAIVRQAREMRAAGGLVTDIAATFGVKPATMCDAINGKWWKHV